MNPGEIYRHDAFYRNRDTGELERKYLLVLAHTPGNDIVARLLTSRAHGRSEHPRCYHGLPYGGFYLGTPGAPLTSKTWVDLRYLDDIDASAAQRLSQQGILGLVITLSEALLAEVLECVAAADDTTRRQEIAIRDVLANMRRQ